MSSHKPPPHSGPSPLTDEAARELTASMAALQREVARERSDRRNAAFLVQVKKMIRGPRVEPQQAAPSPVSAVEPGDVLAPEMLELLRELLSQGATSADHPVKSEALRKGLNISERTFGRRVAMLKDGGFIDSNPKRGRRGGYWLLPPGLACARAART